MKTYKFWNPENITKYSETSHLDPTNCTAAELTAAESKMSCRISTELQLTDDKQAAAIVQLIINETVTEDICYEEIKEAV
tara:strand:- start:347 stop:586 length:240 start_codon:yes stop_codon:yes gene_type:complete